VPLRHIQVRAHRRQGCPSGPAFELKKLEIEKVGAVPLFHSMLEKSLEL
jgi:hypothetical protein